jgi:hypothetical protein
MSKAVSRLAPERGIRDERLSNCHRTVLTRQWLGTGGEVNWIMLNPSTADDVFNDPTIRKCIGFSKRWGFSRLTVTNLFSFRATYPSDLREIARLDYARAVGVNDGVLIEMAARANLVVAAWGTHGNLAGRADDVLTRVLPDVPMWCIGFAKGGMPLHPCMAGYTPRPLVYREIHAPASAGQQKENPA